jgi:hypothetical protein
MFQIFLLLLFQTEADTVYNLRDFRLPDAGATQLHLGLSMWVDRYDLQRDGIGIDTDSSGLSVSAWRNYGFVSWALRLLGEQRFVDVNLYSSLGGGLTLSYYDSQVDTVDSSYTLRFSTYRTILNSAFNAGYYLKQSSWFVGGIGSIEFKTYTHDFDWLFRSSFYPLDGCDAFFQIGYGKVRDATPVVHSWYFLEEMNKVSSKNIATLADVLARRWSYQYKYWRHEKVFYPDVENKLLEDNVVEGFSVYEAMRLREIVEYFPQDRLLGARAGIGPGISNFGGSWYPAIRLTFLGGAPLTRRWQLSGSANATAFLPTHTTIAGYFPEYEVTSDAGVYYYIGERWQLRSLVETHLVSDVWQWSGWSYSVSYTPIGLIVYIDNYLNLNLYTTGTMETNLTDSRKETAYFVSLVASLTWRPQ